MRERIPAAGEDTRPMEPARRFVRLLCSVMTLSVAACATVAPATPRIIGVLGSGTPSTTDYVDIMQFRFDPPTWNAATRILSANIGSTVRFSVPHPTSIELEINGKRLVKSQPPLSRNYEYAGRIENPGENPAIWSVEILTPFDIPYYGDRDGQAAYVLNIVNVSGSIRSRPLQVYYTQPFVEIPRVAAGGTSRTSTNPVSASRTAGPCPGGAREKPFTLCWRKSGQPPYETGTTGCSHSEAVRLLENAFPGFSNSAGACS